jgi:lipid-A-disaccharide synthase
MGFTEVVANLPTILRNMSFCKRDMTSYRPDVVVFIDYPGFNIPMAEHAKRKGLRTAYYISPQLWAWKEGRVRKIKRCIDRMLVILPFEKEFYRKWDYEVEYVGHPLLQALEQRLQGTRRAGDASTTGTPLVALLPGSRKQEVQMKLPVMLEASRRFPDCRFAVAQAPGLDDGFIRTYVDGYPNVEVVKGDTYGLLLRSDAALVTSGTATLETALLGVPEVVCYKGGRVSYEIAKRLIKVPYISLVNLIMGREVVKELIQHDLTADNLARELKALLYDADRKSRMQSDYRELREILGKGGNASDKAAALIVELAKGA